MMNGENELITKTTKTSFWNYALNVNINTIVYLHCHQHCRDEAVLVLVGQDGVQHPPLQFPSGNSLFQFLSCLENGLLPEGKFEPPLTNEMGVACFPQYQQCGEELADNQEDFVFRILNSKSNGNNCELCIYIILVVNNQFHFKSGIRLN